MCRYTNCHCSQNKLCKGVICLTCLSWGGKRIQLCRTKKWWADIEIQIVRIKSCVRFTNPPCSYIKRWKYIQIQVIRRKSCVIHLVRIKKWWTLTDIGMQIIRIKSFVQIYEITLFVLKVMRSRYTNSDCS